MKKIDINDVYEMDLREIRSSVGGSESKIYASENLIYKIYRDSDCFGEKLVYGNDHKKKLEMLSSLKDLKEAILPKDMIVSKGIFVSLCRGFSMDRIKDCISLYDLCNEDENTRDAEIFKGIMNTSRAMKKIHKRSENIVLSDANFSNVLLEPNSESEYVLPRFADFDSVIIKGVNYHQYSFPNFLIKFYMDRFDYINANEINENVDRLSYLLQFLKVIFGLDIYQINMNEYDRLSEEMRSLKTIRKIVLELKDLDKKIPYIPYLHEAFKMEEEETFIRRYEIIYSRWK